MSQAVAQFNALNGTVATREKLQSIYDICEQEEQYHLAERIEKALATEENKWEINIEENAFECVPKSMLNGLHFEENPIEENNGLNKPVSPNEIYQSVTDLIINTIKEVGYLPWQKEWQGTGLPTARNYVTGKPYTGINAMTLPYEEKEVNGKLVIVEPKYTDIYYLTFNQIEKLGARLKAGSKGRMVTYFNFVYNYENKEKGLKLTTSNASDIAKFVKKHKLQQNEVEANLGRFPVLKYYRVFKATDCENLPVKEPKKINAAPNEIADKIIELYPNSPKIIIGKDERAFYSPSWDEVNMPKINAFNEESFYYSTFFHELIHSTGHPKRLDRNMSGFKGDSNYAFEELIAELGAVYLCAESGILFRTIENSAKYLRGWHKRLVGKLEKDNKFFFKAAASAQKGSNYILKLDEQGEPAYRKHFEVEAQKKTSKTVFEKPTTTKEKEAIAKKLNVNIDRDGQYGLFGTYQVPKKPVVNDVLEWAEKNLYGTHIYQSDLGKKIHFEKSGIKKAIYGKRGVSKLRLQLVYVAKQILQTSRLVKIEKDKKGRINVLKIYKLLSFQTINGVEYKIFITIRETTDGILYYEHNGVKIEKHIKQTVEPLNNGNSNPLVKPNVFPDNKVTKKIIPTKKNDNKGLKGATIGKIKPITATGKNDNVFFKVNGSVGEFLQAVERKPFESVVITMDGQQGAGKTTTLYKFIDAFASAGNSCLFISGEEHPESALAIEKRDKYLSNEALQHTSIVGDVESIEQLYEYVAPFEIIFIDSWQKLQRMVGAIRLDEDLRKKFNGKVFVVIFQQTTTGRTKGGAEVVFDGDIIIKMVKEKSFAENYAYFDKNRYTLIPIENIRYNIASGTTYNPNEQLQLVATETEQEEIEIPTEEINLSFEIN